MVHRISDQHVPSRVDGDRLRAVEGGGGRQKPVTAVASGAGTRNRFNHAGGQAHRADALVVGVGDVQHAGRQGQTLGVGQGRVNRGPKVPAVAAGAVQRAPAARHRTDDTIRHSANAVVVGIAEIQGATGSVGSGAAPRETRRPVDQRLRRVAAVPLVPPRPCTHKRVDKTG